MDIQYIVELVKKKHPGAMITFMDDFSGVISYPDKEGYVVLFNNLEELGDYLSAYLIFGETDRIDLSTWLPVSFSEE